jgi:hypothetical protein
MHGIMKSAVNQLYRLLRLKIEDPRLYDSEVRRGGSYTAAWDDPAGAADSPAEKASHPRPPQPEGGVLVTIPLESWTQVTKSSTHTYAGDQRRNRLEQLLSFIAFTIKKQGLASAAECRVDRNRLNLLLAGGDPKSIEAELRRYLELFRLPEHGKMVLFKSDSTELRRSI